MMNIFALGIWQFMIIQEKLIIAGKMLTEFSLQDTLYPFDCVYIHQEIQDTFYVS